MTHRIGHWCQTFTGRAFWPLDPLPEDVCDEDIAHALSLQCRFAGHCAEFYSVAEHSVRVSWLVSSEHALAALLHDAAEAYVVDVPRPLKLCLIEYGDIETRVARAVGEHFGVELVYLPDEVRLADEIMLATEKRDLMRESLRAWPWPPLPDPIPSPISPWKPQHAKNQFLARLRELTHAPVQRDAP